MLSGWNTGAAMANETIDLSPGDLAELLGMAREDGAALSVGTVRLPAEWVAGWRAKRGPLELSFADVELLTGIRPATLYLWRRAKKIACRAPTGGKGAFRVAPAELVRRLRQIQVERGCQPVAAETPGQLVRRARRARERAIVACGGSPDG